MANPAHRRVIEVRVDIETTYPTQVLAPSHLHQHLTRFVETVRSITPFVDQPRHQALALSPGSLEESADV